MQTASGGPLQLIPERQKYLEWSKMTPEQKREYRTNRAKSHLQSGPNITNFWEAFQTYIGNRDPENPDLYTGIAPSPGLKKPIINLRDYRKITPTQKFYNFIGGRQKGELVFDGKSFNKKIFLEDAQFYNILRKSGVNTSKLTIEDIRKAQKLRQQNIQKQAPKLYNYQVGNADDIKIYGIKDGKVIGDIDISFPEFKLFYGDPVARVDMVRNLSPIKNGHHTVSGVQKLMTDAGIQYVKQATPYRGLESGKVLLRADKTKKMYDSYKDKEIIGDTGAWSENGVTTFNNPIYLLKDKAIDTPKIPLKSRIFNPNMLTRFGKMKVQWNNPDIYYKNGGKI